MASTGNQGLITLHTLADGAVLRCEVEARPAWPTVGAIEAVWAELCAANPRLFDGPIYSVVSVDADAARLGVHEDTFKRLVTQGDPRVLGGRGVRVRLLGVKAVITGRDADGREHVLVNRRHPHTRAYGGLWEVGPGGGVGPDVVPAGSTSHLTAQPLLAHLAREASEELGIELLGVTDAADRAPAAFLVDEVAHSVDVVFMARWRAPINPRTGACRAQDRDWEYLDSAWLARDEVPTFVRDHPGAVSPATLAIWRATGWLAAEPY